MPDDLVFMMGKYAAHIPADRLYSPKHLWFRRHGDVYRVGFTAYSVRLLQDVYFLDWAVDAGTELRQAQEVGEIESSKALSTLYSPCAGRLTQFNEQLLDDPSAINTDCYDAGWLYELETVADMLTPAEYMQVLEDGWEDTQRLLKGQIN